MSTPDPIDIGVGARIRLRRRWLGLSQTQLAQACNITFQQIQKYERGGNRVSASMLVRVAAKLQTTVAALIGEDGKDGVAIVPKDTFAKLAVPGAMNLLQGFCMMTPEQRRSVTSVVDAILGAAAVKQAVRNAA